MTETLRKYEDLLRDDRKVVAQLGTVMPDGTPQVTPIWFDYQEGRLRVNSARGRVKDRNMRRNPAVALSLVDPENAYRYVSIRGRVVEVTEEGADAHIDRLARKYLGKDRYPWRRPGEVRVSYTIVPERVSGMG
jgi:PPOX class probable F420-dependent enzyme